MYDINSGNNVCKKCNDPLVTLSGCSHCSAYYVPKIFEITRTCIRDTTNPPIKYYNVNFKNRDDCSAHNPIASYQPDLAYCHSHCNSNNC